jgi:hypothetical protein
LNLPEEKTRIGEITQNRARMKKKDRNHRPRMDSIVP